MKHKTINHIYQQLSNVVINTYSKSASNLLMVSPHGIVVYNKYLIRKTQNNVQIIFRSGADPIFISSTKNALIWVILDHHNKIPEAKRVKELDSLINGIRVDDEIHNNLKNKGGADNFLIQSSKLQRNMERQKQFLHEIDKYNIIAQKCQHMRINK